MEALGSRIVKSVPMVALGITSFLLLFTRTQEPFEMLGRNCPQKALYSWRSGVEPLDHTLCVLVAFFFQGLITVEGQWVTGYLLSIFSSAVIFMGVEGSRLKSGWLLSLTPLHALIAQSIGVSVAFPLLWLPTYFLYGAGNRDPNHVWKKKISVVRVGAIAFCSFVFLLNNVALLFPLEPRQKQTSALYFQVMPVVISMFWLIFPTSTKTPQPRGHKGVIALHLLQAGYGLAWHATAILFLIRDPQIPARAFLILTSWTNDEYSVYFLMIDALVLVLALLYLAAIEDGFKVASVVILGALIFGPGSAVSFYLAYREQTMSKSVKIVTSEKKE